MYTWAYIHVQDKIVSIRVPCMYNRWKVELSMISLIQGVNTKRWSDVTLIPLSPAATKNGICLRLYHSSPKIIFNIRKKQQTGFFLPHSWKNVLAFGVPIFDLDVWIIGTHGLYPRNRSYRYTTFLSITLERTCLDYMKIKWYFSILAEKRER